MAGLLAAEAGRHLGRRPQSYGHPNEQVIDRLKEHGTEIYRTDLQGEVDMAVTRKGIISVHTKLGG